MPKLLDTRSPKLNASWAIRKPRMLVAIALANKMARMLWAMLVREEDYRDPTGAVC